MVVEHRTCSVCIQSKDLSAFPNNKTSRKGKSTRCRECANAYLKKYYQENKEKSYLKSLEWKAKNSEKYKEAARLYRLANKERLRLAGEIYYRENKTKFRERNKKWEQVNHEKVKCYKANYRARRRDAPGSHTGEDLKNLFLTQKGLCVACMSKLGRIYHVDHIQPLSLGGSNDKYNLQLLCISCNSSKQDKDPIKFMQQRGRLL